MGVINNCISACLILIIVTTKTLSKSFTYGSPIKSSFIQKCSITGKTESDSFSCRGKHGFSFSIQSSSFTKEFDSEEGEDQPVSEKVIRGGDQSRHMQMRQPNIFQKMSDHYMKAIEKNPMITKSFTAGIIMAIGDVLSQYIESKNLGLALASNFKWLRLRAFLISGWFYVGPFVHYWYDLLWKIGEWQEKKYGTSKVKKIWTQVFVDQTVGVALFFPAFFFVYELMEAIAGLRMPVWMTAKTKMQNELFELLVVQYKIWPLTNFVNFAYVPQNLRVLFSNLVSVFWNTILCMKLS